MTSAHKGGVWTNMDDSGLEGGRPLTGRQQTRNGLRFGVCIGVDVGSIGGGDTDCIEVSPPPRPRTSGLQNILQIERP